MTTYIALLRGINVGGHKKIGMSDLRSLLTDLGFDDARSRLQTGNLVFHGNTRAGTGLERLLEVEAEKRLDLRTTFFVRTAQEWAAIIARNPFHDEAESDPGHLVIMFLKDTPHMSSFKALHAAIKGPEIIRAGAKHVYIVYAAGIGRSRLTNNLIESKLGTRATGRNWNTALKLAVLAEA